MFAPHPLIFLAHGNEESIISQPAGPDPPSVQCRRCRATVRNPLRRDPGHPVCARLRLRDTGACGSTGPGTGSRRGCRCSVEPAGSTSRSTTTRPTAPSRLRGRSGVSLSRRRTSEDLGPKGDLNDWLRVGAKGRSGRFPVDSGAGARGEPDPLGSPDPAVTLGPGAVGSGGPCRRARSPVRDQPSGSAEPRCAPAPFG